MMKFLGVYRGAALYEYDEIEELEGKRATIKIVAKAMTTQNDNLSVTFVKQEPNEESARKAIKKTIDHYLEEHNMDQFVTDVL
jgi:hypothetical protein